MDSEAYLELLPEGFRDASGFDARCEGCDGSRETGS